MPSSTLSLNFVPGDWFRPRCPCTRLVASSGSIWELFAMPRVITGDRVTHPHQRHSTERGTRSPGWVHQCPTCHTWWSLFRDVPGAFLAGPLFSNRPCSDGSLQHCRLKPLPCAGVIWTLNKRKCRRMQIRRWEACNRNDLSWQLCAEVRDCQCLRQVKGTVVLWHKLLILKGRLSAEQHRIKLLGCYRKVVQSEFRVCGREKYCPFLSFCDFVRITEYPQQIHIFQLKQHFEAGSYLCYVGFFFLWGCCHH